MTFTESLKQTKNTNESRYPHFSLCYFIASDHLISDKFIICNERSITKKIFIFNDTYSFIFRVPIKNFWFLFYFFFETIFDASYQIFHFLVDEALKSNYCKILP